MSGPARTWLVAAVLGLVLAECGEQEEVGMSADEAAGPSLRNVDWQLATLRVDGRDRDLGDLDAVLRVSDDDLVNGRACNSFSGKGVVGPDSLRVTEVFRTQMLCSDLRGEIDELTVRLLRAGASWSISDGALRLAGDAVELTYRVRAAPWSSLTATPLLEGSFGSAVYRLAWSASDSAEHVGVGWESRDRPGTGLSSSGLARSATEAITHLDPSGVTVAGRGFVFVPAPLGLDRVVWERTEGSVELQRFALPPARTWQLFAGFVGGSTLGGQAVGYAGSVERLRSRVLPY